MRDVLPKALFDGQNLLSNTALACEGDVVVDILALGAIPSDVPVAQIDAVVTPGLFDVQGSPAGAHITLSDPVARRINHVGTDIAEAARMATANALDMMRLTCPGIVGHRLNSLGYIPMHVVCARSR